jgi:hypothetical protein
MRGELWVDDFDRNPAVERRVSRQKHDSHTPAAQLAFQPILGAERTLKGGEEVDGRIAHVRDQ